ncbi:MAG: hypothetical protein ACO3CT_03105 [Vulcanococcus sp.]
MSHAKTHRPTGSKSPSHPSRGEHHALPQRPGNAQAPSQTTHPTWAELLGER